MSDEDDDSKPVPGWNPKRRARSNEREQLIQRGLLRPAPDDYQPVRDYKYPALEDRELSVGEKYGWGEVP